MRLITSLPPTDFSITDVIKAKKHQCTFVITILLLQKTRARFLKSTLKRTLLNLKLNSYPEYSVYASKGKNYLFPH